MAQSYIDKYVFALMLDSSNFEKGANLATKAANGIKNTLLKTYSIIGGIDLFKSMVTDYTDATRSIDNLSLVTGENITTLQAWKKSIQDVGGNVGAFEGTLKGLANSLADLRQFGKYDDRLGILGWRGISLYQDGKMKNATTLLSEIAKKIKDMNEADAFSWARALGIDESTYRLFRLHGENIDNLIKKNKQWAILNKEDIKTMRKYDQIVSDFKNTWLSFSREIMSTVLPIIQKELLPQIKDLFGYILNNRETLIDSLKFLTEMGINASKAFVSVVKGSNLVIDEIARKQAGSEKKGKGWGSTLWGIVKDADRFYGNILGNYADKLEKDRLAFESKHNMLVINNMNVVSNDPESFKEGLSSLAETGRLPANKLDLIPQVGVNVSSL